MNPRTRGRFLAHAAMAARQTESVERLLTELDSQGWWGRHIALQIAGILHHREYIRRCLATTDPQIALDAWAKAIRHHLITPEELSEQISQMPSAWRKSVLRNIRRRSAGRFADQILDQIRSQFGDREAASVLPACSASKVRVALPQLAYCVTNWGPLARRHPHLVLEYLRLTLESGTPADKRICWTAMRSALSALTQAAPAELLNLFAGSIGTFAVPSTIVAPLARHDPERMLAILLDPSYQQPIPCNRPFVEAIRNLPDERLIAIAKALGNNHLEQFLRIIAPSRRAVIFSGLLGDRSLFSAGISISILDTLPAEARDAQARRLLDLRRGSDDFWTRVELVAHLPWAEAESELRSTTTLPDAQARATGYRLLLSAAAASSDQHIVQGLLESFTRVTNEQDPVRMAVLAGIGTIPARLISDGSAAAIQRLSLAALQARDCSWGTRQVIQELATQYLVEGAVHQRSQLVTTATNIWEHLSDLQASLSFGPLHRTLPRGGEYRLFTALEPRIAIDAQRGNFDLAIGLAYALGRRGWGIQPLQFVLDQARQASADAVVHQALDLWLADPSQRSARVEAVVRQDPSTIALPTVAQALAFSRPDLLADLLGKKLVGRFLSTKTRHVPIFHRSSVRQWPPSLQQRYQNLLLDWLNSPGLPSWERAQAIGQLGMLRGTAGIIANHCDDVEIKVAEAALATLAWTEDPAVVLPLLLSHVNGPQARVAMYAATGAARFVPPQHLQAILEPVLQTAKVTARKETVRLLAQLRALGAVQSLVMAWQQPQQHHDVRRAIVASGLSYLDDPRIWTLLSEAARDDKVASALLAQSPEQLPAIYRQPYGRLLRQLIDSPIPTTRVGAMSAIGRWARFDDGETPKILLAKFLDLTDTSLWRHTVDALVTSAATTGDCRSILNAAEGFLAEDDQLEPTLDRDQPRRQRLITLASSLSDTAIVTPELRQGVTDLATLFAEDTTLALSAVKLHLAAIDWTGTYQQLMNALAQVFSIAGRVGQLAAANDLLTNRLEKVLTDQLANQLLSVAAVHATSESGHLSQLSLVLAQVVGPHTGWPQPWREVLVTLRQHALIQIRNSALNTFTARE